MNPFVSFTAIAAPLLRTNVNTDAIIPGSYLRSVDADLAHGLFSEWRYGDHGRQDDTFILNRKPFDTARILFAGDNFGCGSSREAAVWALQRFGFKAIFSTKFADIFSENAQRNGLLLGILPDDAIEAVGKICLEINPRFTVDLEACQVTSAVGTAWTFDILPARRLALIRGDDEIALTLARSHDIDAFHSADRLKRPWSYTPLEASGDAGGANADHSKISKEVVQ